MGWNHGPILRLFLLLMNLLITLGKVYAYPAPVDFSGQLLRWQIDQYSPAITFAIEADNPDDLLLYEGTISYAAALWSNVPGSYFKYRAATEGETPQVTIQLKNTLSGVRNTAGFTSFDQMENGAPKHCSITVQVGPDFSEYDLAKVFLHELGHGLGLGHSLVPEAIMSYSLDKNRFALDIDDNAAVAHSYPADGSRPSLPLGCAVLSGHEKRPRGGLLFWILIASPLLISQLRACGRWLFLREA